MKILDILREEQTKRIESFKSAWERHPTIFLQSPEKFKIIIENNFMIFDFEMDSTEIGDFIDGDYKVGTRPFFETFLSGDTWELYQSHSWDGDWESALNYHADQLREDAIKEHILRKAQEDGADPERLEDMSLEDLINEYDDDDGVIDALRQSLEECEEESFYKEVHSKIEDTLSEYGDVISLNYEGAKININLSNVFNNFFDGDYNEMLEWIEEKGIDIKDYDSIFRELLYEDPYGEKPSYSFDDRWHADVDNANFNSVLSYRLSEFMDDDIIKKIS